MGVKNNNTNGTSSFKKNLTKTESFRSSSHLYEERKRKLQQGRHRFLF